MGTVLFLKLLSDAGRNITKISDDTDKNIEINHSENAGSTEVIGKEIIAKEIIAKKEKKDKTGNAEKNICPVETTLDLIGGKYKALILWHLSEGTLRYSELQRAVPAATPRVLTNQLRELEDQKLITRTVYPVVPPKVEYSMTELGASLMPILTLMRDWGTDYLRNRDIEPNCYMMEGGDHCCKSK